MFIIKIINIFLIIVRRKEVVNVAMIYVALIIKGKKTFAQVPGILKAQVKQLLVDLELDELAAE